MDYEFLDKSIDREKIILPNSDKINPFLLKNNHAEIMKAVDFIKSEEKFLYIHGFLGTGKRQFVNYFCEFLAKDVVRLEYYCKEATVCDDIILNFVDVIEEKIALKSVSLNAKITTPSVKFQQQVSAINRPFLVILHSYDDVLEENRKHITDWINTLAEEKNVKIVVSTRAMNPAIMGNLEEDRKIFLKAFTKEIFKEFLDSNEMEASDKAVEDFYECTRGYYYYTALSIKIMQAMKIKLSEFLQKVKLSGMSFDSYLGFTYINLIPTSIRNFFWFLRTVRHGLSFNALAVFDIYDEFSIEYLKSNLMIFQVDETIYVQDYFLQKIDISIPQKTEIRLHKYIIGIYEKQLKEPLKQRAIMVSRQAMRLEIEYHNQCIDKLENQTQYTSVESMIIEEVETVQQEEITSNITLINEAKKFTDDKKYTDAIESYRKVLDLENLDLQTLVEVRLALAGLYKVISDYQMASHYYDLVETYYKQHNEVINLNYLYYEMTDLYFKMYKHQRAVETIKKVVYSVDTPQSLMVNACTLLGNIYSEMSSPEEAYSYYKKALDSLDENVEKIVLAELYFKYALANDDRGDLNSAFEYYNRCIFLSINNPYKASAYSNLASCYYEQENFDDALNCFRTAYKLEKDNNNYEGVYYNASKIAEILTQRRKPQALDYLIEAKKSAEFINEDFYIAQSTIALGDYYYNFSDKCKDSLKEYFLARKYAESLSQKFDISIIQRRINDMKLRMTREDFEEVEMKYGR